MVLARGQILRHDFTLTNPTGRPLKILGAQTMVPCCSAIGPLPDSIPPGGVVPVPTVLQVGAESRRRRLEFMVRTDSPEKPTRVLTLNADLVAEVEFESLDATTDAVPLGRAAVKTYRITCRRIRGEGRGAPDAVSATLPLTVAFAGNARETTPSDGVVVTSREVSVTLPAAMTAGDRRGEIRFLWPGGGSWPQSIGWRVALHVETVPSGLVLAAASGTTSKTVLVRSKGQPFRIVAASGPALAAPPLGLPTEAKQSHAIALTLDPARAPGPSDVRFATDDPDQPEVLLSVFAPVSPQLGGER